MEKILRAIGIALLTVLVTAAVLLYGVGRILAKAVYTVLGKEWDLEDWANH